MLTEYAKSSKILYPQEGDLSGKRLGAMGTEMGTEVRGADGIHQRKAEEGEEPCRESKSPPRR